MATDGNKIASYMKDASSNLRSEGRKAVYAIIATAWTISFTDGMFPPTCNVQWALGLTLSYLFLDLLYFLITSSLYKYLLTIYFNSVKDADFQYKDESKRITETTKCWMHIGQVWLIIMSLILLVSFVFMFLAILALK